MATREWNATIWMFECACRWWESRHDCGVVCEIDPDHASELMVKHVHHDTQALYAAAKEDNECVP
jgi:hypothetical protein